MARMAKPPTTMMAVGKNVPASGTSGRGPGVLVGPWTIGVVGVGVFDGVTVGPGQLQSVSPVHWALRHLPLLQTILAGHWALLEQSPLH